VDPLKLGDLVLAKNIFLNSGRKEKTKEPGVEERKKNGL